MIEVIHCKVEDFWKMVIEYQQLQKLLWALSSPEGRVAEQKAIIEALKSRLCVLMMDVEEGASPSVKHRFSFDVEKEIGRLKERIQVERKSLEALENLGNAEEEALIEYQKKWKAWQAKWTRFGAVEDYAD